MAIRLKTGRSTRICKQRLSTSITIPHAELIKDSVSAIELSDGSFARSLGRLMRLTAPDGSGDRQVGAGNVRITPNKDLGRGVSRERLGTGISPYGLAGNLDDCGGSSGMAATGPFSNPEGSWVVNWADRLRKDLLS